MGALSIIGFCDCWQGLLGVEQDGDFAFVLDGDGQIGSFVVVEIADGEREAAVDAEFILVTYDYRARIPIS